MPPKKKPEKFGNPVLDDFRNFLFLVWKHLGLPDPTKIQYEIADYLQHGPKRQIIMAFRGVGKSWITSAFVLWCLLRNPQDKFMVVSASKIRSDDFSTFTLRLINEMPILQHLKPSEDQRNSKISFDVAPAKAAHAPSVKSVGVFGQMAGSRANHIIADDTEVPNNSATEDMREKLLKAVSEFEAIIVPGGRVTFLGTPQTEDSVYNKLRTRDYDCQIWPARFPSEDKMSAYAGALADSIKKSIWDGTAVVGDPTDPARFTDSDLIERETSMGKTGFTLQFMLDTTLSDRERYPLKLSDLIVMDLSTEKAPIFIQYGSGHEQQIKGLKNVGLDGDRWYGPMFTDEKWSEYEGAVMAIDPAGRGGDEVGYAIVKQLHGNLFILEASGHKGGYEDETLDYLCKLAKKHKVNEVIIEANFGDGMYSKLMVNAFKRNDYRCLVTEVKHSAQKEKRICDTLEPVMCAHRLIVNKSVIEQDLKALETDPKYALFYQMTRVTRERGALRHDDRLDALAIAVSYWVESMGRNEDEAARNHREKLKDEALKAFVDGCTIQSSVQVMAGVLRERPMKSSKWTSVRH